MAETYSNKTPEKFWRWYRNFNAIGAVALAAAGVILPQYQAILFTGAAINGVQAVGAEAIRQSRIKKHKASTA